MSTTFIVNFLQRGNYYIIMMTDGSVTLLHFYNKSLDITTLI